MYIYACVNIYTCSSRGVRFEFSGGGLSVSRRRSHSQRLHLREKGKLRLFAFLCARVCVQERIRGCLRVCV